MNGEPPPAGETQPLVPLASVIHDVAQEYRMQDADDRRLALDRAVGITTAHDHRGLDVAEHIATALREADRLYQWLRKRESLTVTQYILTVQEPACRSAGHPGGIMGNQISLADNNPPVILTLTPADAKGFPVPGATVPEGTTVAWSVSDDTVLELTESADGLSGTVAFDGPGTSTVSANVTSPDGSTGVASEVFDVSTGPVAGFTLTVAPAGA